MSEEELRQKLVALVRQLAYEINPTKIADLQGRSQITLETMDARGIKWMRTWTEWHTSGKRKRTGNGKTSRKDVIMNYDTWIKVMAECHNDDMRPWCKIGESARAAMINAHADGAIIEVMGLVEWRRETEPRWHKGNIYRVCPPWPGPANPALAPAPEYVDKDVFLVGVTYRFTLPSEAGTQWVITLAPSMGGFVGYVYETDGREWCIPTLLVDKQADGTYRLSVPKAVRFMKGAA